MNDCRKCFMDLLDKLPDKMVILLYKLSECLYIHFDGSVKEGNMLDKRKAEIMLMASGLGDKKKIDMAYGFLKGLHNG